MTPTPQTLALAAQVELIRVRELEAHANREPNPDRVVFEMNERTWEDLQPVERDTIRRCGEVVETMRIALKDSVMELMANEIYSKTLEIDLSTLRSQIDALKGEVERKDEALKHISKVGHELCKHYCAEHYIPRGMHSPECPNEYYGTADDALTPAKEAGR